MNESTNRADYCAISTHRWKPRTARISHPSMARHRDQPLARAALVATRHCEEEIVVHRQEPISTHRWKPRTAVSRTHRWPVIATRASESRPLSRHATERRGRRARTGGQGQRARRQGLAAARQAEAADAPVASARAGPGVVVHRQEPARRRARLWRARLWRRVAGATTLYLVRSRQGRRATAVLAGRLAG
jgi:hypothetical protein